MLRPLRHVLLLGLLLSAGAVVRAAPPPPGTVISNTAALSFDQSAVPQNSNTVAANIPGAPALTVTLAANTASSTPGATVTLTPSVTNNGAGDAMGVAVTVNGAAANLLLLTVPVPANTGFASAQTATAGAQTLYHVLGAAPNAYVTVVAAGTVIDGVAFAIADLAVGATLAGQLSVTINANASSAVSATAVADWTTAAGAVTQTTPSNTVTIRLPVIPASIAYFTNTTYATPSVVGASGSPLFVQVNASMCNTDPSRVLTAPVTVTSRLTGDVETFNAVETGPNTGLFRIQPDVPTANARTRPVVKGDGILEVLANDVVTASVTSCSGVSVSASTTLLIDPAGVAFDSHTNQPVAGATVELIDVSGAGNGGNAGGPARVLEPDGTTLAPSTVVTGANGGYAFPIVAPSTYRLLLIPPGGYAFPSKLAPAALPPGHLIDQQGSYGAPFTISGAQSQPVRFDLPLDAGGASSGLLIQKSADKLTAQVGDFVDYTVQINNKSPAALSDTVLEDQLPAGFSYVRGSARLNGAHLADPAGGAGPSLNFAVGLLAQAAQATLSYRVRIGVGAQGGTATNLAQALSGLLASNRASATVQITGGVFSDKAYLFGKIFADCNRNGVQDAGEPGIPGVRIYLEDGTYVVSDEQGKYSLYGLTPRMHVAKVDLTTLPAGTRLEILNNRNAFDAGSTFVDLTAGELHKVDFAVAGCSADLSEQIAARRKALTSHSELLQAAATLLSPNTPQTNVDPRSNSASGVIRLPGATDNPSGALPAPLPMASGLPGISAFAAPTTALGAVGDGGGPYAPQAQGAPQRLNTSAAQVLQDQALATTAARKAADDSNFADFLTLQRKLQGETLEKSLPQLDGQVGFVNLQDGWQLPVPQTNVQVTGPLGTHFELTVNGRAIAESQVGKKSTLEKTRVLAWEYIGLDMNPGANVLKVRAVDEFGIERGTAAITVFAPGPLARILIEAPAQAVADAATAVTVRVLLRDANDLPVTARTRVALGASLGQWQLPGAPADAGEVQSALSRAAGNQVFITGGAAQILLLPPAQPGKAELSVESGALKATRSMDFTPNLRPLLGVGLVSAALNLRNLDPSALRPAQSSDVFEREIANVSRSFDGGKGDVGARTALFLKGKILGSTLLTLAYDSDKPSDTTLFRDIQPDQFYPVYGDSAARGYDAQSTGKLYVMVQNGTNYVLYGDYTTQSDNPARLLTQYARALNGARGHWSFGKTTVDGFASETSSSQSIVELRANGTSGPFQLDLRGITNSQQVDIITRDRNQPTVILNDTPLTPFADYAIEPYTGLLLLTSPVPSVDSSLNPVYIHVSYSIDSGGPKHWVEGADARLQVTAGLTLGATAIHDADPGNELSLEGINLTAKLDSHTAATAEIARSASDLQGDGYGEHLDVQHTGTRFTAHLWGTHTGADFYNPNSLQSAGASQYGLKAGYKLDDKDRLVAEGLESSDSVTGAKQTGAQLKVERTLPHNAKLEVGVRHSEANAESVLSAPALPGTAAAVAPVAPVLPPGTNNEQAGYTSVLAKLTVPVPQVKGAEMYGLAEKAVDGSGEEYGVGGTYAVNSSTRIYAQHDFINSLNGPYTLNPSVSQYTTVAGISSTLPDTTQLFNEYRAGDAIDGRSSEAAVGMRRQWKLPDGWGVSASVQRIAPLSGVISDAASAVTLGLDYTAPGDWKGSSQAQWASSDSSHTWLATAGVAHKLNASWTLLDRVLYTQQTDLTDGGGRELARVQSGVAYRPVSTDVWNALGQLEYLRDFDTTLGPGLALDEQAWIMAGNLNIQPRRGWEISARYAAKRAIDWTGGFAATSWTQLLGARSTWDLNPRWDLGVNTYRMWGNGAAQYAVGPEVGYLVWKNLWVCVGYNVQGFDAPELTGQTYTQRGIYLHLNFKFDESLLSGAPLPTRQSTAHAVGRAP
ncbi:MAG TPA: SdrD B-like domain-containing protein [Steroidobacteraceae bacterium]|nr:SdrD B-like domain-containing protein [Steroidobacteraceae bacterium]